MTQESDAARAELLSFLRSQRYGVVATVSPDGVPQAAIVGIAVSDRFEIVFDTLDATRKARNLTSRGAVAIVVGSTDAAASRTAQIEGRAEVVPAADRDRLVALYLSVFPDGVERQSWPGLIYVRVRPTWIRDSDFAADPVAIREWQEGMLVAE